MAYFNHAFQQTHLGSGTTGYINAAAIPSVDFLSTYGVGAFAFTNPKLAGNPNEPVAPADGTPLVLTSTSIMSNDKIGPFHGGYHETNKSKLINPKFINRFYRVDPKLPTNNIIGIGYVPGINIACCPEFLCNETYDLRIDIKGSAALRTLGRNAYEVAAAYTGCCDGPTPTTVDPALVMKEWMTYIANDPIMFGTYGQYSQRLVNVGFVVTCDDGDSWDLYLPDNAQAGVAGLYFAANGTTPTADATAFRDSLLGTAGGRVDTFGSLVAGTGYATTAGVATTGGTGFGLIVDITAAAGPVTAVVVAEAGYGYTVGDVITITGGDGNSTITITAIEDLAFTAVLPASSYVSTYDPEGEDNCCAGLVLESAFQETKFGNCTFDRKDHYELEPLTLQASMLDNTGDPCVFAQLCIHDGITPSGPNSVTIYPALQQGSHAEGTGECILRDFILDQSYRTNDLSTDLRIREITQGNNIVDAVNRNTLYTSYYILHSVPRFNNPSGMFDNDQYLLRIITDGTEAAFEAFMSTWLAGANNFVTLETL